MDNGKRVKTTEIGIGMNWTAGRNQDDGACFQNATEHMVLYCIG